jgi:hypothetical protein
MGEQFIEYFYIKDPMEKNSRNLKVSQPKCYKRTRLPEKLALSTASRCLIRLTYKPATFHAIA